MSDAVLLRQCMEELKRRFPGLALAAQEKYDFTDYNFPRQAQILADLARFQAWLFTRRFGKSTTFAKKGCGVAANNPGAKVLFLALTLDSARGILWDAVEKELKDHKVPYRGYYDNGIFELGNGSIFRFFGVDAGYNEMKKVLGQAYDLVGLDESGSMRIDVETLIMHMIYAALIDRQGSLVMLGTAENIPNTFYQRVTEGKHKDLPWSIHKGHTSESPYTGPNFDKEKAELIKRNPDVVKTSWFRTHWMNEWCADDDLLIIKFDQEKNRADKLPDHRDWIFGLGVDLGFNDATSFTVDAMSPKSPYLYRLKSFKTPGLDFTGVSKIIRELNAEYGFTFAEVDGANKQGVEEMQNRHDLGLKLTAAEKSDKATYLRLMNDDYKEGRIKHVGEGCVALENEQSSLQWIKDSEKEDPRCENHCNDGALYIWRKMRTYFKPEVTPWKSTDQKMEDQFLEEARRAMEERDEESLLY
jgi:hypothetical protein